MPTSCLLTCFSQSAELSHNWAAGLFNHLPNTLDGTAQALQFPLALELVPGDGNLKSVLVAFDLELARQRFSAHLQVCHFELAEFALGGSGQFAVLDSE